jgi:hypothetical protein
MYFKIRFNVDDFRENMIRYGPKRRCPRVKRIEIDIFVSETEIRNMGISSIRMPTGSGLAH